MGVLGPGGGLDRFIHGVGDKIHEAADAAGHAAEKTAGVERRGFHRQHGRASPSARVGRAHVRHASPRLSEHAAVADAHGAHGDA